MQVDLGADIPLLAARAGEIYIGRDQVQIIDDFKDHRLFIYQLSVYVVRASLNCSDLLKWLLSFVDKNS